MTIQPLQIVGGEYRSRSLPMSAQSAVNVFPEINQGGNELVTLTSVPGITTYHAVGPIRGMIRAWGLQYYVAGNDLYLNKNLIGSIDNDEKPVSMAWNTTQLAIVTAGVMYVHERGSTAVDMVTDPDLPANLLQVAFLDGYGILTQSDTDQFYWTALDDFTTIDGTDTAAVEGDPDVNISLITDHREAWFFSGQTTEVYYNSGTSPDRPIVRAPGGFLEKGCAATHSTAKVDNSVFWLGDDLTVYRADGFNPVRVSNHGIEQMIEGVKFPRKAQAMTYGHDGHQFYLLHFPDEFTIVYDAATQSWHKRCSPGRPDSAYSFHLQGEFVHYVGGENVYILDPETYTHNGSELTRTRAIGPLSYQGEYKTMPYLGFRLETGSGDLTGKKIWIRLSDDGGRTWTDRIETTIGPSGNYQNIAEFWALGGFYERVIEINMTDNAPFNIAQAWADIQ